jgi:hypothetical protein
MINPSFESQHEVRKGQFPALISRREFQAVAEESGVRFDSDGNAAAGWSVCGAGYRRAEVDWVDTGKSDFGREFAAHEEIEDVRSRLRKTNYKKIGYKTRLDE